MSKYDRGPLPIGEEQRLNAITLKVLMCLQLGPTTNAYFAANVCLDYRKRVNELRRQHGYHIKARRIKGQKGLFEFRLLDEPEPEWEVVIKTISPDAQFLIYSIVVNATTEIEARNNAPRKYVRNVILDARPVAIANGAPWVSPTGNGANFVTRMYQENQDLRALVKQQQSLLAELHKRWRNARESR